MHPNLGIFRERRELKLPQESSRQRGKKNFGFQDGNLVRFVGNTQMRKSVLRLIISQPTSIPRNTDHGKPSEGCASTASSQ